MEVEGVDWVAVVFTALAEDFKFQALVDTEEWIHGKTLLGK